MKILFIHNFLSSFVKVDLELLKTAHQVREVVFRPTAAHFKDVVQGVAWCDVVVGWWATWHMLMPALLAQAKGKGVIVVGGDYDVVYDPFGASEDDKNRAFRDRLRWQLGRILFPKIDRFLAFSEYSTRETLKLPYVRPERVSCLYLGLSDLAKNWDRNKTDLALAVGRVSRSAIVIKGWNTFVKAAQLLPEHQFELVGPWKDDGITLLRQWNNQNVKYSDFLPEHDLRHKMNSAKVIVQASYREGFGLALAEAMLFECAPVVTERCSIPEVVGDTGLYVPYGDVASTASAIDDAFHRQGELGPRARSRILDLYPLEKRRKLLLEEVERVYSQHH